MNKAITVKLSLLIILFLPEFSFILLQLLKSKKAVFNFPIESLSYTSTALTAVSFSRFFNTNLNVKSLTASFLMSLGMLIIGMSSISTITIFQLKDLGKNLNTPGTTIVITTFTLSLIYFLFSDYFFHKYVKVKDVSFFEIDEVHKLNFTNIAKAFNSFIKFLPKLLVVSVLITIALYIIFHYENNIVNHLGVVGGVITIITLFDNRQRGK